MSDNDGSKSSWALVIVILLIIGALVYSHISTRQKQIEEASNSILENMFGTTKTSWP